MSHMSPTELPYSTPSSPSSIYSTLSTTSSIDWSLTPNRVHWAEDSSSRDHDNDGEGETEYLAPAYNHEQEQQNFCNVIVENVGNQDLRRIATLIRAADTESIIRSLRSTSNASTEAWWASPAASHAAPAHGVSFSHAPLATAHAASFSHVDLVVPPRTSSLAAPTSVSSPTPTVIRTSCLPAQDNQHVSYTREILIPRCFRNGEWLNLISHNFWMLNTVDARLVNAAAKEVVSRRRR